MQKYILCLIMVSILLFSYGCKKNEEAVNVDIIKESNENNTIKYGIDDINYLDEYYIVYSNGIYTNEVLYSLEAFLNEYDKLKLVKDDFKEFKSLLNEKFIFDEIDGMNKLNEMLTTLYKSDELLFSLLSPDYSYTSESNANISLVIMSKGMNIYLVEMNSDLSSLEINIDVQKIRTGIDNSDKEFNLWIEFNDDEYNIGQEVPIKLMYGVTEGEAIDISRLIKMKFEEYSESTYLYRDKIIIAEPGNYKVLASVFGITAEKSISIAD